jgi:hypothetical protein
MAETKNTKTPTAAKKPASGKKSSRESATVTATAASKAPAKKAAKSPAKKSVKKSTAAAKNTVVKSTAAAKKPASKKADNGQQAAKVRQRSTFSEQFLPYIFGGLALIFAVLLLLNAVGGASNPEEHLMGYVGYYLCQSLFGCFGWAAYLIPLVFINLTVFWRRYCEERLVPVKLILSVLIMVMISSVIHVGVCTSDPSLAKTFDVGYLYRTGALFESGGVVGGVVGNLLYTGLRLPGTVVLSVVALPLILMLLVGVTPAYVFGKLWAAIKAWRERSAEERESRREERETRRAEREAEAEAEEIAEAIEESDEEAAEAEAQAKALEERLKNPTTEDLLKQIIKLLEDKKA